MVWAVIGSWGTSFPSVLIAGGLSGPAAGIRHRRIVRRETSGWRAARPGTQVSPRSPDCSSGGHVAQCQIAASFGRPRPAVASLAFDLDDTASPMSAEVVYRRTIVNAIRHLFRRHKSLHLNLDATARSAYRSFMGARP